MNDLLVADSVSKSFGNFKALNEVSIAVPKGSIFGASMSLPTSDSRGPKGNER